MKKFLTKVIFLTAVGLFSLTQGCATPPQPKTDTDQIKHNADDSYKELQHEEHP